MDKDKMLKGESRFIAAIIVMIVLAVFVTNNKTAIGRTVLMTLAAVAMMAVFAMIALSLYHDSVRANRLADKAEAIYEEARRIMEKDDKDPAEDGLSEEDMKDDGDA